MNQVLFNPWAPPFLNGFNNTSADNCDDVDGGYVWPPTNGFKILTANQQLADSIILDPGDDFQFSGFIWSLQESEFGSPGFLYRIKGSDGQFISDGFVYCFATPGTLANPWPIFPSENYALHRRLDFEIINLLAHPQGVQLMFRGRKRFQRV